MMSELELLLLLLLFFPVFNIKLNYSTMSAIDPYRVTIQFPDIRIFLLNDQFLICVSIGFVNMFGDNISQKPIIH